MSNHEVIGLREIARDERDLEIGTHTVHCYFFLLSPHMFPVSAPWDRKGCHPSISGLHTPANKDIVDTS